MSPFRLANLSLDFAAAVGAAVFHAYFGIDPFPNRVAGCASGQEAEQGAGEGSDACPGCRAEYRYERTDGGSRRRAGTESRIGAPGSDCSSDDGPCLFSDPVSDHEFVCVTA